MTRLFVRRLVVAGLCFTPLLASATQAAVVTITGNPTAPCTIPLSSMSGGTRSAYSLYVHATAAGNWQFMSAPYS